ncbi:uncharacterized protein LOC142238970 [Haematobia irritans]|uniref:uncharacterized protein LOC142238970 n=1 Tax=Haematobia irritans TaxID=7368 RepID=UPI003F50D1E9
MCLYMSVPQWLNLQNFLKAVNASINHTIDVTFMLIYFKCFNKPPPKDLEISNGDTKNMENYFEVITKNGNKFNAMPIPSALVSHGKDNTNENFNKENVINFNYNLPFKNDESLQTSILCQQQQHQQQYHYHHHHHQQNQYQQQQQQMCNNEQLLQPDVRVKNT